MTKKTRTVYRYVGKRRGFLRPGQFISKGTFDGLSRIDTIEQEIRIK